MFTLVHLLFIFHCVDASWAASSFVTGGIQCKMQCRTTAAAASWFIDDSLMPELSTEDLADSWGLNWVKLNSPAVLFHGCLSKC